MTKWLDDLSASRSGRAWLYLALLGAVLFLPLLGRYGLWDPHEVKIAEIAREMAHTRSWTVPARFGAKPALLLAVIAAGYRFLGHGEIAGRLPVALLSLAALLGCCYAGNGLLRRRGALLGSFALLTMPVFFLGARQLTSAVAPVLATTLAIGGLARAAWPRRDEAAIFHLLVGLCGLALGQAACGFALGVAVPLVAIAVALLVSGPAAAPGNAQHVDPGDPERAPPSGMALPRIAFGAVALGSLALVTIGWLRSLQPGAHSGYSWILGGAPHLASHQTQATSLLKQVGFGAFPWIVVAPLAAARLFAPRDDDSVNRDGYGRFVLLAWAIVAYVCTTLYEASVGDITFGAYPAIALLAGAFLDDALEAGAAQETVAAAFVLVGAAVIAHDFFMAPEGFVGAHVVGTQVNDALKWPPLPIPPYVILCAGLLWGVLLAGALVVPDSPPRYLPRRSALLAAALGASLALAAVTIYWIVPAVSAHLSFKGLFVKYKSIIGTGSSEIGRYHVPGQLSDYGSTIELSSPPQMFDFLARPDRVFVISAADDLPSIDQYAKQRAKEQPQKAVAYYVIDDSNSKFLMLSNQIGHEQDLNPLRRFVLSVEGGLGRTPQHPLHVDFEGKVELLGYDLPPELERGKPFKITMYYKVNAPVGGGYRVFIHFDGPGTRFNGDHTPLDGKFPTNFWVPGFYIIDEFNITPDRVMQPAGVYTIYTGFWLGAERLKVSAGPQDGENRVRAGTVRVK